MGHHGMTQRMVKNSREDELFKDHSWDRDYNTLKMVKRIMLITSRKWSFVLGKRSHASQWKKWKVLGWEVHNKDLKNWQKNPKKKGKEKEKEKERNNERV